MLFMALLKKWAKNTAKNFKIEKIEDGFINEHIVSPLTWIVPLSNLLTARCTITAQCQNGLVGAGMIYILYV